MNTTIFIAGVLWLVTLWRLPSLRHSHKQRSLTLTLAALAAAMTLEVSVVKEAVNGAFGPGARLPPLLKHMLGVVSAAYLLDFVIAVVRPQGLARRIRLAAIGVTLPLMIAFYALANWMPGGPIRLGEGEASIFPLLYMSVFTLYIGVAMIVASWLFLGGVRHSRTVLGKAGLALLCLGTLLGSLYAIQRVVFITIQLATGAEYPALEASLSTGLKQLAILSIAFGVCLPPLSVAMEYLSAWSALRRLRPLWWRLTEAAPHVVLTAVVPRWRVTFRLERCVIEIEDACLTLREYVSIDVLERARSFASRTGLDPEQVDAVAEASWLCIAASAARTGGQLKGVTYPPLGSTGKDRESELAWLLAVSCALSSSPVVTDFARQDESREALDAGAHERPLSHGS
ncbi:MAB_1171c family putative transporter [Streptomyces sp. NPDC102384]|uniref:MAB_1171c family putative transporter n=1 Tax=Streptomyces sp. NPDC102384 TaxID=3366166 RepID=UPI0037FA6065